MMASDESICIPADDEGVPYESCGTGVRHRIPIVYVSRHGHYAND
jgi:hypothetical protein